VLYGLFFAGEVLTLHTINAVLKNFARFLDVNVCACLKVLKLDTQAALYAVKKTMENNPMQYMVDFTLPTDLPEEFVNNIPRQRAAVNRLLGEGKILNYALSLENSKLWVVFAASSEAELMEMVQRLPLTRYMKLRISELTFYNASNPYTPAFSVN
jgi:muconolactone delta-isomerase